MKVYFCMMYDVCYHRLFVFCFSAGVYTFCAFLKSLSLGLFSFFVYFFVVYDLVRQLRDIIK